MGSAGAGIASQPRKHAGGPSDPQPAGPSPALGSPDFTPAQRLVLEQALCHVALLLERVVAFSRNLGLVPRTSTSDDPLGPIVVSDEDISTILGGFRKIRETPAPLRSRLLPDPFAAEVETSTNNLMTALGDPEAAGLGLVEIMRCLQLEPDEQNALLLMLAPELDARFGRIFGYLRNDPALGHPTRGLIEMALRPWFSGLVPAAHGFDAGKLANEGLLQLDEGLDLPRPARPAKLHRHVSRLATKVLERLVAGEQPARWESLFWPARERDELRSVLRRSLSPSQDGRYPLVLLEGPRGSGRASAADAAAATAGIAVVHHVVQASSGVDSTWDDRLEEAILEARLRGALLVVRSDGVMLEAPRDAARFAARVAMSRIPCVLLARPGEADVLAENVIFIRHRVPRQGPRERRVLWSAVSDEFALSIEAPALDDVASRYDLPPGRVRDLGRELATRRREQGKQESVTQVDAGVIRRILREMTSDSMRLLAQPYHSNISLDDLVLPDATRERLDGLIERMRHRYVVLEEWNFARGGTSRARGVSALFVGPPGTGKTAAAGGVARALDMDLYTVDLSKVVSKWLGETEKNLAALFDEAEAANVALLFDEADALFSKRSVEVKSSVDRYANLTVNFLLQRIEQYEGLVILTTNLENVLDEALTRRIAARIHFPAPDLEQRRALWKKLLPPGARYARGVDLRALAEEFELSGAHIRNALLRAAFKTAAGGASRPDLSHATLRSAALVEYQDMGRVVKR